MSKLTSQWIDIFRVGNYGEKGNFTEADVDRVVASYDPGAHEAPATIGHPKDNLPAYGWVNGIRRVGDVLQAKFAQVEPQFAEMVEAGRFNKRSASFYKDAEGKISGLRHVAFLGAQPPEVKGLKAIQFSEQDSTEVEFQEDQMAQEDTLIARLNAWLDEKFPKHAPTTTATFSEDQVKAMVAQAVNDAVKPFQAQVDAHTASFSEAKKSASVAEVRGRAADAVSKLKTAGKWVPAFERMGLPVVFAELAKSTDVVEFGEGAAKKSKTPLDTLVEFMESLAAIVPAAAVYTGQNAETKAPKGINAGPKGYDPNSLLLHNKITEFAEANKVSYAEATFKVAEKYPELTIPGGAAAGAV